MVEVIYQKFLECRKVSIDTRKEIEGSLFFGLKGENFNGGVYAEKALGLGAAYAVVDDEKYCTDERIVVVDDCLDTLQNLALKHRNTMDIPVLAITGSNGKTTTKELINHLLKEKYKTHYTPGNYNNHIGLPLTILSAENDTEFLILEMGASAVGEIQQLCDIGNPKFGLITNIGPAHLEGFGDIDGVKRGKSELYRHLTKVQGTAFVNMEEKYLSELSQNVQSRICYSSKERDKAEVEFFYTVKEVFPEVKINYETTGSVCSVETALYGQYNAMNIMSAITIARYFGVENKQIHAALRNFKTQSNRSEIVRGKNNQFVMDAYNANPTSMMKSIEAFANMDSAIAKVVILGDMKELGPDSLQYHEQLLDFLKNYTWDEVYLVGSEFYACHSAHTEFKFYAETVDLLEQLAQEKLQHKFILLKGSRSMELERIKDILI